AQPRLSERRVVRWLAEGKGTRNALDDSFVAMAGGLGALEETFEVLTWAQLGIHGKPVGVLNVEGFYDGLLQWLSHTVREGLVRGEHLALLLFAAVPTELLDRFATWTPPPGRRMWMTPKQT